jgi:hypothetical protein
MESERAAKAAKQAQARRALGRQIEEDAERLIADWNERQAKHMPMLFSMTIGAAIAARYWFLWVRWALCGFEMEPRGCGNFAPSVSKLRSQLY